jgi:hypothetical protein
MDYVTSVFAKSVIVHCESEELRRKLDGADVLDNNSVAIAYADRPDLATVLTTLKSLDVPFVSAGPTPPADVFELLRAEGLVTGKVRHIFWRSPGEPVLENP